MTTLTSVAILLAVTILTEAYNCRRNSVAKYKMKFETFWSEETFPKQYPLWRPPASWSVVLGKLLKIVFETR